MSNLLICSLLKPCLFIVGLFLLTLNENVRVNMLSWHHKQVKEKVNKRDLLTASQCFFKLVMEK